MGNYVPEDAVELDRHADRRARPIPTNPTMSMVTVTQNRTVSPWWQTLSILEGCSVRAGRWATDRVAQAVGSPGRVLAGTEGGKYPRGVQHTANEPDIIDLTDS